MTENILYIVSNPFSYARRSVGGNISSSSGVINGFRKKKYHVHVVTDSLVPTLEQEQQDLSYYFYPFRFIRSIFPGGASGMLGRIFAKLDSKLFQIAMRIKIRKLLDKHSYSLCYMRASFNGHAIVDVIASGNTPLVLEVNKPLSMGRFNNSEALNWPDNGQVIEVPAAEHIQYKMASVISIDSSIRAKWVTTFVGQEYQDKILINPNGVDVDMFAPGNCLARFKENHNLSENDIVVGMASSFRWYNDIDEMCRIFVRAVEQLDQLKLVLIVGDKSKKAEVEKKIREYGLERKAVLLCQIPFFQVPALLNCCDILISHFNFHGKWPHNCSIKHLEYLSVGKPAVATDVGEVNFAIDHEVNGLLCGESNIDQFSNAIVRLATDPPLRERLGKAGRNKAVNELTWSKHVEKVLMFQGDNTRQINLDTKDNVTNF